MGYLERLLVRFAEVPCSWEEIPQSLVPRSFRNDIGFRKEEIVGLLGVSSSLGLQKYLALGKRFLNRLCLAHFGMTLVFVRKRLECLLGMSSS